MKIMSSQETLEIQDTTDQEMLDISDNNISASHNILVEISLKIRQNIVLKYSKNDFKSVNRESRRNCKIMVFSEDWNFDELVFIISTLNHEEYPNLFIFIIETKNIKIRYTDDEEKNGDTERVENLKKILLKFDQTRPFILQLTSLEEKITKFYYKLDDSNDFCLVHLLNENLAEPHTFPAFLCKFLNRCSNNLVEEIMPELLEHDKTCSLVYRFLRIFELPNSFFEKLSLRCSAFGSKNDLLAVLDAPFENDGRILNDTAQKLIINVIKVDNNADESDNHEIINEQIEDDSASVSSSDSEFGESDEESDDEKSSNISSKSISDLNPSILYMAVKNSNKELIDYLIRHCTHLIQQLPFKHQVRISTTAFESNLYDVLCDLVEFSDFPFPEKFSTDSINNEKLCLIIAERNKFRFEILSENLENILKFIENNSSLKYVYNNTNKTALKVALDGRKYKIFFHLKSFGFKAVEFDCHKDVLTGDELKKANQICGQQRKANVNNALGDSHTSIMMLLTKSFIHNRKICKQKEIEYRTKIKKWFEDIRNVEFGLELLDVAASCERLKLIFDFESKSVDNISFEGSNCLGSCFSFTKWIFIGSKLSDNKREQVIKGVLAHELCHYVMRLVYENNDHPYYKNRADIAAIFEAIVKAIDKWSSEDSENPNDECNGNISSVFKCYSEEDFHPELIVRVIQILVEFDDDDEKSRNLQDKYTNLFEFFRTYVLPELIKFDLKRRESVRKMNRLCELLPNILEQKIDFSTSKLIEALINDDKIVLAVTNAPKLLLINICNYLRGKHGDLFDTLNIFVEQEKLKNREILKDLQMLVTDKQRLNVFIIYSNETSDNIKKILRSQDSNFIFIMSSEKECEIMLSNIKKKNLLTLNIELNYIINDLTIESKKQLLQTKINFQSNFSQQLYDLLKVEINQAGITKGEKTEDEKSKDENLEDKILASFLEIVDNQLLNYLVEGTPIYINMQDENENNEKGDDNFEYLYQDRLFIAKVSKDKGSYSAENKFETQKEVESKDPVEISSCDASQEIVNENFNHERVESGESSEINDDDDDMWTDIDSDATDSVEDSYDEYENYLGEDFDDDFYEPSNSEEENELYKIISGSKPKNTISQNELYNNVKNKRFVLISDIAGTGKSWIMKKFTNILRENNPLKWVTYVDLKKFIEPFRDHESKPEFLSFFLKSMLSYQHDFESKIFENFYSNGKVFILFDGFDEIAPDCAGFVSNLAKSFESNGGNQLWIATRDYFEIDLKQILDLDTVYKLNEFTERDGINFITRSWLLKDYEKINKIKSKENFETFVNSSPNLEVYKKSVHRIIKKISILQSHSIGLPQLFKMIAENFKSNTGKINTDFNEFQFYGKFASGHYERWALTKGEIRKNANTKSQQMILNFWSFHQFAALRRLFPNYLKLKDLEKDAKKWPDEEVIACGLVTIKNGIFYFIHETFREFFIADYIHKALQSSDISNDLLEIFVITLTKIKYRVIRMFINDAIEDSSFLNKLHNSMQKFVYLFCQMDTFGEFFSNNLVNLVDFIIKMVTTNRSEEMKNVMNGDAIFSACETKVSKMFEKFKITLYEFLIEDEIKMILKSKNRSEKTLLHTSLYGLREIQNFKNLWSIYRKLFNDSELLDILAMNDDDCGSILHIAGRRSLDEAFVFVLEELDKIPLRNEIRNILSSLGDVKQNLLQSVSYSLQNLESHKFIWKIYSKYFNHSEMGEFINYINGHDNNLLYDLIHNKRENADFIWNQMKNFITHEEQVKCLTTSRCEGKNIIQRTSHNDDPIDIRRWVEDVLHEYGLPIPQQSPNVW